MPGSDEYNVLSVVISFLLIVLFVWHGQFALGDYRDHRDERAAVSVLIGVMMSVVAIGLLVSSLGIPLDNAVFAQVGLSIVRGALLVGGLVLLLSDVRHSDKQA